MATGGSRQIDAGALKLLSKLNNEDAEKFVHSVMDGLCEKQGARYETFAKSLSLAEFSKLLRAVEGAVRWVGREGGSKQQAVDMLSGAGVSGDVCRVIGECVGVRREEVKAQLLRDSSQVSPSTLTDFDWKLKLVMASDKLGAIQKPVLNLDLDISENGKRRLESIEMNREELERLITALEAANKVVSQLRT